MTTAAPSIPTRTARAHGMSRRHTVAARGALSLVAVVTLTIPAHLSLQGQVSESTAISAGTAYGMASLLSLVVAASIWRLGRSRAPHAALVSVGTLTVASLLNLYAALTLLWTGASGVADFHAVIATGLAVLGLHLLTTAVLAARLTVAPAVTAILVLTGLSTLAAVFPPGWYPRTSDALLALTLGQVALIGWMGWEARSQRG